MARLTKINEDLSDLKQKRDDLKASLKQTEQSEVKESKKKKGFTLGDMAQIVDKDKSAKTIEKNKKELKSLQSQITALKNEKKKVKQFVDKSMEAQETFDFKQHLKEYMETFTEVINDKRILKYEKR